MADKPSRALVIYGDGRASLLSPSHVHLHSFASRASCGFLSLRTPPPGECENDRMVRELAQLLDAYDFYTARNGQHYETDADANLKESSISTISQRFMGLRAAIITVCPNVKSFARELGFSVLEIDELITQCDPSNNHFQEIPEEFAIASELLKLLGFLGGRVLEKSEFDLLILHIKTSERSKDPKEKMVSDTGVDWLNKLVGGIMQATEPGLDISSRLHFSIILSYGTVSAREDHYPFIWTPGTETNSDLSFLHPRQSYTMKGGNTLNDIRHHHPMLIAQWQERVTRWDMVREFSFKEFREHGGNLAILADRFLHEVAFKLWKAPKYGA
ncbi:uncharacterized protein LOC103719003 [Phoenix dactylifera]|uniref:Uncharacterized protein LOC103719003 n=1 Tax=Phoenix dactylifera TaxID=42345 RepID=A0A8B7CTU4_PHODC|nr:uncharacterized protein LOC103719003 [Phoenix dactylifera]